MKKVAVTGPTGALGIALIRQCVKQGVEVAAVCRRHSDRIADLPKSSLVRVIECNLDELKRLPELVCGTDYDTFFHLGWDGTFGNSRNNMAGQVNNIRYTLDAVYAAHAIGCSRFVGAGSQAEYGRKDAALTADTPVCPENGYGMAKLCAGQMSRGLCEQLGMTHIWARILSVYGPYDGRHTMIMSVIDQLLRNEEPALTKGAQVWDYLYAEDAGRALYLIGEKGIHRKIYPVGSGSARPLLEYVEKVRDLIDPDLPLGIGKREYAPGQVMYLCADISKLTEDTGFRPEYSFEEGIAETIEWCRKNDRCRIDKD